MFYLDLGIAVTLITGFVCLYVWMRIELCKIISPKEEEC
jgi:hypothetical protein